MKTHRILVSASLLSALIVSTAASGQTTTPSNSTTFSATPQAQSGPGSTSATGSAAAWQGREIRGESGERRGTIQTVLVDARTGQVAVAVVSSEAGDDRGSVRFVPIEQLRLDAQQGVVTSGLRASEWRQLPMLEARFASSFNASGADSREPQPRVSANRAPSNSSAETTPAPIVEGGGEQLTPTGRSTPPQRSDESSTATTTQVDPRAQDVPETPVDPVLESAVRSARQNIQNHPSIADAAVEVIPYNGKLLVRGFAESEDAKSRIEDAVRNGARGIPMESHLLVRPRQ